MVREPNDRPPQAPPASSADAFSLSDANLVVEIDRAPRFTTDLRVVWDNGERCASGPAVNLSETGIFVRTDQPPPVDKVVRLMPMINGQNSSLVFHGRVMRALVDGSTRGMGVKFEPQSRSEQRRLNDFVAHYAQRAAVRGPI